MKAICALMLCLVLSACSRGVTVAVSGGKGHPVFTLSKASPLQFAPPCLHSVRILEAPRSNGPALWLARSPSCRKLTLVAYGEAPDGFTTDQGPAPLSDTTIYIVDVAGTGWRGAAYFTWRDGRYRQIDPPAP